MSPKRGSIAFGLAAVEIALRLTSDWLVRTGGPLPYQMVQAALLAAAVVLILPHAGIVFLRGGQAGGAIREALIAAPIALAGGLTLAWTRFGAIRWPTPERAAVIVAIICSFRRSKSWSFAVSF